MGNRVSLSVYELNVVGWLKNSLSLILGALWLFDGLLQLQPQMFTSNFPAQVLLPSFQILPQPLHSIALSKLYPYIQIHEKAFNIVAILTQVTLGVSIIRKPRQLYRLALIASTAWSALIWVFGQAFGGIFALSGSDTLIIGSPSLYTGFPGSALLYLYLSLILLLPDNLWERESRRKYSPIWDFAPLLLIIGIIVQLNPHMFTASGQSTIFQTDINMNIPVSLAWTIEPLARYSIASPLLANTIEVIPILTCVVLWLAGYRGPAFILTSVFSVFAWWFGMGIGATLTGLGTDPNTPPLLLAISYLALKKPSFNEKTLGEYTMNIRGNVYDARPLRRLFTPTT